MLVSDAEGLFTLVLNDQITSKDTVIFSHIGFKTAKCSVSELKGNKDIILLLPQDTELDDVVITAQKIRLKSRKIGKHSKDLGLMHSNFYSYYDKDVDDRLSRETGMRLKMRRNCHIEALNFNVTLNDFKSVKFRVNFYSIENDIPTNLIVQKDIIFEIKDTYLGWFKVDLESYEIYLKEDIEEVAVTIQWLESVKDDEKKKYFAISTSVSPFNTAYFRDRVMDTWSTGGQSLSFYLDAMCE